MMTMPTTTTTTRRDYNFARSSSEPRTFPWSNRKTPRRRTRVKSGRDVIVDEMRACSLSSLFPCRSRRLEGRTTHQVSRTKTEYLNNHRERVPRLGVCVSRAERRDAHVDDGDDDDGEERTTSRRERLFLATTPPTPPSRILATHWARRQRAVATPPRQRANAPPHVYVSMSFARVRSTFRTTITSDGVRPHPCLR